jgi:hypothetical protein
MGYTIWLSAKTTRYPEAGGHFWVYLNWALGLRALGCNVVWLEPIPYTTSDHRIRDRVRTLKKLLEPYGLADSISVCSSTKEPLRSNEDNSILGLEAIDEADLLLNIGYGISPAVVERFRRSAMIDIDPGLTQVWINEGQIKVPKHDIYITIGETVGRTHPQIPDCGLEWHYTPPCVALDWWPQTRQNSNTSFTTVTNWWGQWVEFQGQSYSNGKRDGFLPFLNLPQHTNHALEMAVCMGTGNYDARERMMLQQNGWKVQDTHALVSTPWDYQRYVQTSRGEFSCAKPSCLRFQNAWISDRTVCYLASAKPVIVQHTGPSSFLPDAHGLFRFHNVKEAIRYLEIVAEDYDKQSKAARLLAEEFFDARKVLGHVLERALQ